MAESSERIAVIGLGYVGLPLAVALAERHGAERVIGFDIDHRRIGSLKQGHDWTAEIASDRLAQSGLRLTAEIDELREASFFIVTVPTPIDQERRPDLGPVRAACRTLGKVLRPGSVIVFESTVYPGVTEEICGPVLEEVSGFKRGQDFTLGYSPERINPGDRQHTLEKIVKIISAEDETTLGRLEAVYGPVIEAGLHRAPSIKVAEAAKVIENTQRDLNIALMNELSLIFDRLGIRTKDVLEAAGTKWNFLPFSPGLVGGHCIGVDPYYLTAKAQAVGYHPEVILAGRRINDLMGRYIARRLVQHLIHADSPVKGARVGLLGLTFKENVPDLRNSRVPDIAVELAAFGISPLVHDPLASPEQAADEYGITFSELAAFHDLDAVVLAVPHRAYLANGFDVVNCVRPGGIVVDVKSALKPESVGNRAVYWSL